MTQAYWEWPEVSGVTDSIDWQAANEITAGVDIGTTSAQAVIMCDNNLVSYASIRVGADFKAAAQDVFNKVLELSKIPGEKINKIAATGFGAKNVSFANCSFDEIQCHAKGARFMYGPSVKTVVDVGAQTTKAIKLFDWDRVQDFMMNDKCATGMGRSIEVLSEILQIPIEEIGEKSLQVEKDPEPVSTTCYSFAIPETIGNFRTGFREDPSTESDVLAAHFFAISWRIVGTVGKLQSLDIGELETTPDLAITGGLAKNIGIVSRLERDLKLKALTSDIDPQLAGAIGAALLA